jgi:glyoxylase-like metal-dependent hydrolase (beta-lactamase superfamily II)
MHQNVSTDATGRRQLLKYSLLGGLMAATQVPPARGQERSEPSTTRPAAAEPAMPIVDARFPAEIAPGVYVLPDKRIPLVPNVGIIVGSEVVLVVDCGLGPQSGEAVLSVTRRLAPGRRIVLTLTHAHPEHGFGAQAFKPGARIWYNREQAAYLRRSGATLLAGFRNDVLPPAHRHLLDGVVLLPPDTTFDGARATLDLGGRTVELHTWGTAHSPGDQIVYLPTEGIVFAGDLLEERMFPIIPLFPPMITAADMNIAQWETALAAIEGLRPRLIVPGHGNLAGVELVADVRRYFREVRTLVRTSGQSAATLVQRIRARFPTWEGSHYIEPAIRYFGGERHNQVPT